jgi:hypothetical protein
MELASLSMAEFDSIGMELFAINETIDDVEATLKGLQEQKKALVEKIIYVMKESGKTSYQIGGKKLILSQRATVPTPKTREEKEAFFNYLMSTHGEDVYWNYLSVNSQSLNSFYKAEREAAVEKQDMDFKIPGIGEESIMSTLSVRK